MNFFKSFLVLYFTGFLGILSLLLMVVPQIEQLLKENPSAGETPFFLLAILSLVTPSILLLISVLLGLFLAPKLALRSYIVEVSSNTINEFRWWDELRLGFIYGIVTALLIVIFEGVFRLYISELNQLESISNLANNLTQVLIGILYGGLTEELLLRWGFMTLVAWGLWRLIQGGKESPKPGLMILSIVISSLVFGLGHLPILSAQLSLTIPIIIRTVVLNAIGGFLFGWLYWKRCLESAMIAHASSHIGLAIFAGLLSSLG